MCLDIKSARRGIYMLEAKILTVIQFPKITP